MKRRERHVCRRRKWTAEKYCSWRWWRSVVSGLGDLPKSHSWTAGLARRESRASKIHFTWTYTPSAIAPLLWPSHGNRLSVALHQLRRRWLHLAPCVSMKTLTIFTSLQDVTDILPHSLSILTDAFYTPQEPHLLTKVYLRRRAGPGKSSCRKRSCAAVSVSHAELSATSVWLFVCWQCPLASVWRIKMPQSFHE